MNKANFTFKNLTFLFAILIGLNLRSQVTINEYSCSNLNSFLDNFGEYEDWIELYNSGATAFNLNGYHLSDKKTNTIKWTFGAVSIPANGFLRIWASDNNVNTGPNLHTNFTLTQCFGNEAVVFANPAGTIIDSVTIRRTKVGHSRGRSTNGGPTWVVFTTPTPGASNGAGFTAYATTPTMNLAPGFYSGTQSVTITSPDPNVTIRYTTNGTTPTTSSTAYTGPINISSTTVLRAAAFSSNTSVLSSFVESNTYFINVTHTIPVVSAFGDQLLTLMNGTQNNPETGLEYFESNSQFKTEGYGTSNKHGNDSWFYAQRGIDFVCRDEHGINDALHHKIFPNKTRNEFQRIIIKAAANDNYPFEGQANSNFPGELGGAHIRDAYVHTVSQKAHLNLDERTWSPAILYVNGQYWGVYDVREKVDDKDFTKYYYNTKGDSIQMLKTWGSTWSEYGGPQAQTDWNTLSNFILNNNMTIAANYNQVAAQYDLKSLADYVILNSYVVCSDWLNWNTQWWRGLNYACSNKKWKYSLWDEDATFKHYINYTGVPSLDPNANPCDPQSLGNPGSQGHVPILNKLLMNQDFKQYYVMRYFDLLNSGLSCTRMVNILDSMVQVIQPEMQGQITKWGGTYSEWQQNVLDLRNFILQRCSLVTQQFAGCYQTTGPFNIKVNVDPPNSGTVQFNSNLIQNFVWSGIYPGNLPSLLNATAKPGYCFTHWTFVNHTPSPNANTANVSINLNNTDSIVAHFAYNPQPLVTPVSASICRGESVQLNATNGITYNWSPSTGLSCNNCPNPIATPNNSTTYTLTSIAGPGCQATTTQTITVHPYASANFTSTSANSGLPQTVSFSNNSTGASNYIWTFGTGANSTSPNPNYVYTNAGTYTVTLIALGFNNCNDTITKVITISDTAGLVIPNVFSPNGDGINDFFQVISHGLTHFEGKIYDRWGKLVFEFKDANDAWKGTNKNGSNCDDGVYYYIIQAKDMNGKEYDKNGFIELIR